MHILSFSELICFITVPGNTLSPVLWDNVQPTNVDRVLVILFVFFFPRDQGGRQEASPENNVHVVNCSLVPTGLCQLIMGQRESSLIFGVFWKEVNSSLTLSERQCISPSRKFFQVLDSCFSLSLWLAGPRLYHLD